MRPFVGLFLDNLQGIEGSLSKAGEKRIKVVKIGGNEHNNNHSQCGSENSNCITGNRQKIAFLRIDRQLLWLLYFTTVSFSLVIQGLPFIFNKEAWWGVLLFFWRYFALRLFFNLGNHLYSRWIPFVADYKETNTAVLNLPVLLVQSFPLMCFHKHVCSCRIFYKWKINMTLVIMFCAVMGCSNEKRL